MSKIFQFKIKLEEVKPVIWRRIQISADATFYDLHIAIQDAMGWHDSHLHEFQVIDPVTDQSVDVGLMNDTYKDIGYNADVLQGTTTKVKDYLSLKGNDQCSYVYDFGDDWQHLITLEKILDRQPDTKYPICIDGARACPPEDIGGVFGYEEFLEIIKNKNDPSYDQMIEMCGADFDPETFEPDEVVFRDSKKCLRDSER